MPSFKTLKEEREMRLGKKTPAKHSYLGQVLKFTQKPITGSIKKRKQQHDSHAGQWDRESREGEREKQTETQRHTKRERHRAMRRRYLDLIFQTVMGGEIIWKDKG